VERFDPSRDVRFFTYAAFLVRRNMVQAIARGTKTVRIPRQISARIRRFREEKQRLTASRGEEVGAAEVAQSLGLSEKEAQACAALQAPFELSVDEELRPDEGGTRADFLADESILLPDASFAASEDLTELRAAMEELDERDRRVLVARFGLDGQEPRTLRDLSSRMNLSKERIRQLEERAKNTMRRSLDARRHAPEPGIIPFPQGRNAQQASARARLPTPA
jgi:RNA polymerase primary sigma factor